MIIISYLNEYFLSIRGASQLGFTMEFLKTAELGLPASTDEWSEEQLDTPQLLLVPKDLVAEYLLRPFNERVATDEQRREFDEIPVLSGITKSILRSRLAAIDWVYAEYEMDIEVDEDILAWIGPLFPKAAE